MPRYAVAYAEPAVRSGWWLHGSYDAPPHHERSGALLGAMEDLAWQLGRDVLVVRRGEDGGMDVNVLHVAHADAVQAVEARLALAGPAVSDADLAAMRRRSGMAPAGPWFETRTGRSGGEVRFYAVPHVDWADGATGALQEFIAHSRQDVPSLLMEVERLRIRVKALESRLASSMEAGPEDRTGAPPRPQ